MYRTRPRLRSTHTDGHRSPPGRGQGWVLKRDV